MPSSLRTARYFLRAPLGFSMLLAVLGLGTLPFLSRMVGPHPGFLPAVLAVIAFVDLLSVYLLVQQFRREGSIRALAMSWAYAYSLVIMLGYALSFPGVFSASPPLASTHSIPAYLYVLWHGGFPVLLAFAWAPLLKTPLARLQALVGPRRLLLACATHTLVAASAASLVALVVGLGSRLPVLVVGVDTSRMTHLTAPVVLPLAILAAFVVTRALRAEQGPERWTVAASWVCVLDLSLTYLARQRFSVGWYVGRSLTLVAAAVVLLAMVYEITQVKQALLDASAELSRTESLQRTILDHLTDSVLLLDAKGRLLLANDAARRNNPELCVGEFPSLRPMRDTDGRELLGAERPMLRALHTQEEVSGVLVQFEAASGTLWLTSNHSPVRGAGGEFLGILCSYTDVTAREEARRALQGSLSELALARDAAVEADRAKSGFLAATSHELRTPLNGLLGMASLLRQTPLDASQTEFVTTIETCGAQLLGLLTDVLDFSKAEAGRLELEPSDVDLLRLCDELLYLVSAPAKAKGLTLSASMDAAVPRFVRADPLRLRQALTNLLGNAVKFTPTGSVSLHVSLRAGQLSFEVRDTGVGIAVKDAERLFEPFVQADASTTREFGGTGLGLAITRELIELHGGAVGARPRASGGSVFWANIELISCDPVEPTPLAGTTFACDPALSMPGARRLESLMARAGALPAARGARPDRVLTHDATRAMEPGCLYVAPMATLRETLHALSGHPLPPPTAFEAIELTGSVLVAEDNLVNQRVATLLLESIGLTVTLAATGREAVELAMQSRFDVIVMDCHMPVLDGLEATAQLRACGLTMPIIALTASASSQDEALCRAAGMDGYLTKPIDAGLLARTLAQYCAQAPTLSLPAPREEYAPLLAPAPAF